MGRFRKHKQGDADAALSSPPHRHDLGKTPPPPFHFLASLFLDGRSQAERKVIVYLDPNEEHFNDPHGTVQFRTRWVEGLDGKLREHGWVFKDVGIETVFDKLLIKGDKASGKVSAQDEGSIISSLNAAELGAVGDLKREERMKLGQILVKIERVKLGEKYIDNGYRPKHKEGDMEEVDMDAANKDIVHTAGSVSKHSW